jgi:hypothetical protein
MMAETIYAKRTKELRQRLSKTVNPTFEQQFNTMIELLGLRYLSHVQQSWCKEHILRMRDKWTDPDKQPYFEILDEKVIKAQEKLQRRQAKRAEERLVSGSSKAGRSRSIGEQPVAPTPPTPENDSWSFLNNGKSILDELEGK